MLFDKIMIGCALILFLKEFLEDHHLLRVTVALILSLILDLTWLIIYSKGFMDQLGGKLVNDPKQAVIEEVTVIFVYLNLGVKVAILIIVALLQNQSYSDQNKVSQLTA